jgi:hypothetical protein
MKAAEIMFASTEAPEARSSDIHFVRHKAPASMTTTSTKIARATTNKGASAAMIVVAASSISTHRFNDTCGLLRCLNLGEERILRASYDTGMIFYL